MSVQITTLLRASRNQDEDLIKYVLEHILSNGISEEDLNAVDCSGRTAISYICSTNVTNFLEVLLETPGIDINKPDIEFNTPLHYAAECGQLGVLRLLLSQKKVNIDAKNIFGFTPLMKAAMQGHIRCAKLLLFAGASPLITDNKRMLRAEQWARFCGRHSCADVIDKCTRVPQLNKESPFKWSHETFAVSKEKPVKGRARANSAQTPAKVNMLNLKNTSEGGIRSKISKVLNFVSRDKSSNNQSNCANQTNNSSSKNSSGSTTIKNKNTSPNTFSTSKPSAKSNNPTNGRTDSKYKNANSNNINNRGVECPIDVPKLEVTSPHNQELIKKYESRYNTNSDTTKPPVLPPRRNSKIIL